MVKVWCSEMLDYVVDEMVQIYGGSGYVEDYPADDVLEERGVEYRDDLCGLFTGIPITHQSIEHSGVLPNVVTIYREGILSAACDPDGRIAGLYGRLLDSKVSASASTHGTPLGISTVMPVRKPLL